MSSHRHRHLLRYTRRRQLLCLRSDAQQTPRQHLLDPARQLHRHPHRLPAARRAARLDRREPRSTSAPPRSCATSNRSSTNGSSISPTASGPTGSSRWLRPGESRRRRRRPGLGRRPASSARGLSTKSTATKRLLERQYDSMVTFVEFCRARSTKELLPPSSSTASATGSASPPIRPRMSSTWPISPRAPASSPRPHKCSAKPTTPRSMKPYSLRSNHRLQNQFHVSSTAREKFTAKPSAATRSPSRSTCWTPTARPKPPMARRRH